MVAANHKNTQDHENQQGSSSETKITDQQKVVIKCPRCDSPNTKFCYYNNYSLTQPRHFCKTCRRYWTNGGSLRNVPIGGGCRKKQKLKHSSTPSQAINKYSTSPSLDFHLGSLPLPLSLPFSSKPFYYNQFSSIGGVSSSNTCVSTTSASSFHLDPNGLNLYPFSSSNGGGFINGGNENAAIQGMNFMNVSTSANNTNCTSLASSIESLSCRNQDLHLKLQQQRLATLFEDNNRKESGTVLLSQVSIEKPQPILFQNLEISKAEMFQVGGGGDSRKEGASEWFFGMNSYSSVMAPSTTTDLSVCINGDHDPNGNNNWINNGVHAWGDVQQQQPYTALP